MKRLLLFLTFILFSLFSNDVNAQSCMDSFIKDLMQISSKRNERYYKTAQAKTEQSKIDNYKCLTIINIPVIFSTKEASKKVRHGEKLNKNNFFCYFNPKSLAFNESLILQDTNVIGVILQSTTSSESLEFIKNVDAYKEKLAKAILKINPDFIFEIYNISRCYWCIKNKDLSVLSFNKDTESFMVYNADFYFENELTEEDLFFITDKKVFYHY